MSSLTFFVVLACVHLQGEGTLAKGHSAFFPEAIVNVSVKRWIPIQRLFEANPRYRASEFVGLSKRADVRFDLIPNRLVASRLNTGLALWSVPANDAIRKGSKIFVLRHSSLLELGDDGQLLSSRLLPDGYRWVRLDLNLKYAVGQSERRSVQGVFAVNFASKRVTPIPIDLDYGREEVPRIISLAEGSFMILREDAPGWCRPLTQIAGKLVRWSPHGWNGEYWVCDVLVQKSGVLLLIGGPEAATTRVYSWPPSGDDGRRGYEGIFGFVRDSRNSAPQLCGYSGGQWLVHCLR